MFKFQKKTVIRFSAIVFFLLVLSAAISLLQKPSLGILKQPLGIFNFFRREAGGLIFYHHNYVENERLNQETDLLKQKINALNEIYLENQRLKKLISFKQQVPYKAVAAKVIGRSADSWSSVIIIDKGSFRGIKRGMAVITYLGLIGRVIETAEDASKVMLINDPNLSVSAIVQRSRQEGLVCGTLGNNLIMKYLPQDADIQAQDLVVASGLSEGYQKGLLIGTVISVGNEFSGLSRYAIIKPAVNLSDIEEVLIIIP